MHQPTKRSHVTATVGASSESKCHRSNTVRGEEQKRRRTPEDVRPCSAGKMPAAAGRRESVDKRTACCGCIYRYLRIVQAEDRVSEPVSMRDTKATGRREQSQETPAPSLRALRGVERLLRRPECSSNKLSSQDAADVLCLCVIHAVQIGDQTRAHGFPGQLVLCERAEDGSLP